MEQTTALTLPVQDYRKENPDRCRRKVKVLTQDYIIPVSRGGVTEIGNIVPACRSCNSSKSSNEPRTPLKRLMI